MRTPGIGQYCWGEAAVSQTRDPRVARSSLACCQARLFVTPPPADSPLRDNIELKHPTAISPVSTRDGSYQLENDQH